MNENAKELLAYLKMCRNSAIKSNGKLIENREKTGHGKPSNKDIKRYKEMEMKIKIKWDNRISVVENYLLDSSD